LNLLLDGAGLSTKSWEVQFEPFVNPENGRVSPAQTAATGGNR